MGASSRSKGPPLFTRAVLALHSGEGKGGKGTDKSKPLHNQSDKGTDKDKGEDKAKDTDKTRKKRKIRMWCDVSVNK